MTLIEKILSAHSKYSTVKPGDIVDIEIDTRVARDFGGANVIRHITDNRLTIDDPAKTFFTFDCNPAGSDQKYAVNQHACRMFARENNIMVYDINAGIIGPDLLRVRHVGLRVGAGKGDDERGSHERPAPGSIRPCHNITLPKK